MAVSFIGGGNRKSRRKPPTCRKSLNIGQIRLNFHICEEKGKEIVKITKLTQKPRILVKGALSTKS
jgi:hypothetical protein